MIAALSGTNLVHDNAYLGAGLLGSLEMILMNSDIIGYVKRLQQGIEVSDESLCVDLIDKVGPGGQFMTEMHTFSNYKKSVGLELRWRSPMGDLRFAYGYPLSENADGTRRSSGRFEFSMGQAF